MSKTLKDKTIAKEGATSTDGTIETQSNKRSKKKMISDSPQDSIVQSQNVLNGTITQRRIETRSCSLSSTKSVAMPTTAINTKLFTISIKRLSKSEIQEIIDNVSSKFGSVPNSKRKRENCDGLKNTDRHSNIVMNSNQNTVENPKKRMTRARTRAANANELAQPSTAADSVESCSVTTRKRKREGARRINQMSLKEKIQNKSPSNEYMVNEMILASIPGYCAWPARILNIYGETIMVQFLGTGHINPIRSNALARFELNKVIPLMERKGFRKAIHELELILKIPENISLFKQ